MKLAKNASLIIFLMLICMPAHDVSAQDMCPAAYKPPVFIAESVQVRLTPSPRTCLATYSGAEPYVFVDADSFSGADMADDYGLIINPKVLGHVAINKKVDYFLSLYQTSARERFKLWLSRSTQYMELVNRIFEEYGVAEDLVFLPIIESGYSPHATSRAKAAGIWQFMKKTAKLYGLRVDAFIDERRDPVKSTVAAARHLKNLHSYFGSWDFALAAYNAGAGKITKAMKKTKSQEFPKVMKYRRIKVETKEYVPKFVAASMIAKEPELYGFTDVEYLTPVEHDDIMLPAKTTLKSVATVIGIDEKVLAASNPAIKYGILPPDSPYIVRIPKDKKEVLFQNLSSLKQADQKTIKKIIAKETPKKKKKKAKAKKSSVKKVVSNGKRVNSNKRS